jgi:hypothetical protein
MRYDSGGNHTFDIASPSFNYTFLDGASATLFRMQKGASGEPEVGIGVANPLIDLHIYDGSSTKITTVLLQNSDTGSSGGDGGGIAASSTNLQIFNKENDEIEFWTNGLGRMSVSKNGNLSLGGTTGGSSGGLHVIEIYGSTAPTSSPTDTCMLFAVDDPDDPPVSHEMRVRDEAGNSTTISPHNFKMLPPADPSVELPWSFYSENPYIGVEQNVDMARAIRDLEDLTGVQYIYDREMDPARIEGWYANQVAEKARIEAQRLEEAMKEEIECPKEEAIEQVELTAPVSTTVQRTVYELDPATGEVFARTVEEEVVEQVPTGQMGWTFKAGARLDRATGKFYRRKKAEECQIEPYEIKDPPAWIAERLVAHNRL